MPHSKLKSSIFSPAHVLLARVHYLLYTKWINMKKASGFYSSQKQKCRHFFLSFQRRELGKNSTVAFLISLGSLFIATPALAVTLGSGNTTPVQSPEEVSFVSGAGRGMDLDSEEAKMASLL